MKYPIYAKNIEVLEHQIVKFISLTDFVLVLGDNIPDGDLPRHTEPRWKELRVLHLNLQKEWFDKIASGEKTVEYREIKSYWIKRLTLEFETKGIDKWWIVPTKYDLIIFKNGYAKNAPTIIAEWGGLSIVGQSNDLDIDQAFAIQIGKILEVRR